MGNAEALVGIALLALVLGINPVAAFFLFGLLAIVASILFGGID